MLRKIKILFVVFVSTLALVQAQEKGKIVGKIEDAGTSEELIGVAVGVKGSSKGTSTDIEGKYNLSLEPGSYTIVVTYVGYKTEEITEVNVVAGQVVNLNLALREDVAELEEVVITYKAEQASTDALMLERKNAVSVSDGFSAELIKKTPDRTTSDVLKRVTGASIQDNKFAIIRGLNDRYNSAYINGAPLPSTEADRKAFSFDIFPANLLDNLTITKTATPDQTGDFAGGVINLTTKDTPDQSFFEVSAGGTNNSITTYNKFYQLPKGGSEWLGLDNGYRQIPDGVPADKEFTSSMLPAEKARIAGLFTNNWGREYRESKLFGDKVSPGYNFQLTAGTPIRKKFGVVGAITYRRSFAINQLERNNYGEETSIDAVPEENYKSNIQQYKDNVSAGLMLNIGAKINDFNKISLKNTANVLSEDLFMSYDIISKAAGNIPEIGTLNMFTSNKLLNNQLIGEHFLPASKIKFNWVIAHSYIQRDIPDFKRLKYALQSNGYTATLFRRAVNEESGSRLWLNTEESIKSASYSLDRDFRLGLVKTNFKVGAYHQFRERTVNTRMFGMSYSTVPAGLLTLPESQIFAPENIKAAGGLYVENFTQTFKWNYSANSLINAAYFMFDHKWDALRLIWGGRFEAFSPRISGYVAKDQPLQKDTVVVDRLPSMNLVYSFTSKSNLRFSYSQTINRPEFREFSTFAFYDPINQLALRGNPNLVRAYVYNLDLRYEFFPGAGQVVSFTTFYKKFENPIENVLNLAEGAISYQNVRAANNYGVELEIRQNLQSLFRVSSNKFMEYTTLFANLAFINSRVDLSNLKVAGNVTERPLQGQSPYIVNCGLQFTNPIKNFSVNASFNQVGRRIYLVQNESQGQPDIYENPRGIIDIQIVKSFKLNITGKSLVEIKFNVNDLLFQKQVFYQDIDKNGKFNSDKDYVFNMISMGRNVSLSAGLKF